jgi:mRNA-degrading endonuclease HigB of HigAB toxin-antitoxin module
LTTKTLSIANDFTQLKKIQASDAQQDYRFGVSVAVSDTRIVVSSYAGAAYIFDIDGNQLAKIQASGGFESVAVSDTRIVVSNYASGDVHIFDINGNFIAKIQGYNSPDYIRFGRSVAVSDTRIVVGATQDDNEVGSAYIFDINGNELAKIQAFDPPGTSDAVQYSYFGTKVAVSDNRIVVGAFGYPLQEGGYPDNTGAAYIFDINGNQLAKIQASDAQAGDYFGWSVAVSDTRIVVGAYARRYYCCRCWFSLHI